MSATEEDTAQIQRDELHRALHERLVHTGEWHRVMAALRAQLDESGWTAAVREEAQTRAGKQENLSLPKLVEGLTPYAEKTIPAHIRDQVTAMLHDFVSRNVEDA